MILDRLYFDAPALLKRGMIGMFDNKGESMTTYRMDHWG